MERNSVFFKEAAARPIAEATDITSIGRRGFLQWVSSIGAAMMAAIIGTPVLRAISSPGLAKPLAETWVKVADDVALLDVGVPIRLDFVQSQNDAWVESRVLNSVWLYTEDGETFKAYNGRCTHLGCGYVLDKERNAFVCPCHRGQFDIKTGAVMAGPPPRPLDELRVQVRDSAVFVEYRDFQLGVAERLPV